MAVRGVDDDEVDPGVDEQLGALLGGGSHSHGAADDEAAVGVLGGVGELLALDEVLDGDQAAQAVVGVHERELLDLVLAQQFEGALAADADGGGDQVPGGHDLADRAGAVVLEAHVAVGDDADEGAVLVGDRDAGDPVVGAEALDLGQVVLGATGDGVGDHAGLGALDQVDLARLVLGGEVAVQDADAALAGHRHGHAGLGDGVHRGGDQRDAQGDVAGQPRGGVHLSGLEVGVGRDQQNVVIGQARREQFVPVVAVVLAHDTTSAVDRQHLRGSPPRVVSS